jgi:[ribosomal protein S5]-alanine N-acetyltransferase
MIRGRSIALRVIRESDVTTLLNLENDLERRGDFVPNRLRAEPVFRKEFQETGFLTEDTGKLLIVNAEDHILGTAGYFRPVFYMDALEIGYSVTDPTLRGKGVATEAAGLLVGWLFKTKKIARVQLTLIPENAASRRVAEKSGFRFEGVLRRCVFSQGKYVDLEMWALLREEWEALAEKG